MWLLRGGPPDKPVVLFRYDKSRNGEVAKELLDGFEGRYLQCDGYSAYPYAVRGTPITLVGCFDHARRKFKEAEKALSDKTTKTGKVPKCTEALSMINTPYRLERQMNEQELTVEQRTAFQQLQAVPQLQTLHEWLQDNVSKVPPEIADRLCYSLHTCPVAQADLLLRARAAAHQQYTGASRY